MSHPLVDQLWFTRSELIRSLTGVTEKSSGGSASWIRSLGSSATWHARRGAVVPRSRYPGPSAL